MKKSLYIPYVGITDFMTFEQVQQMLEIFQTHLKCEQDRRLHVGVMMSYETLNSLPAKWTGVYPANEAIAAIFQSEETMNCLHYADYEEIDVYKNLIKAISYGGEGIDALQLDMVWPNAVHVANAVYDSKKPLEIILQVGENALEECNNDPDEVVEKLRDYEDIIHHVLLDKSMGQGIGMDTLGLIPFVRAINEAYPHLGITVAGGLGPLDEQIGLIKPMIKHFPDISIDAQGRLRKSGNALDPIEWARARMYLIKALNLLN